MRFFVFLFCFFISFPARADIVNDFVQVQCLQDLNALKIDVFGANGNIAASRSHNNQQELWERHGIREISTMVDYIRPVDENGLPSGDYRDTRMALKNPIQTSCALISETEGRKQESLIYDVYVEPYFFNTNPHGHCGASPTFSLTVKTANNVLIDNLRFVSECVTYEGSHHDKGMAMGFIQSIQFNPEDGYITIDGTLFTGFEHYNENFVLPHLLWLSDDLPINHETVYGHKKKK